MSDEIEAAERLDARLREARERLDRLQERGDRPRLVEALPNVPVEPPRPSATGHVLFVPSPAGYMLVERAGAPPAPGEDVTVAGRDERFVVSKLGASPRPGDGLPCAFLQPA